MSLLGIEIEIICTCGALLEDETTVNTNRRDVRNAMSIIQLRAGPCVACVERVRDENISRTELLIERTKALYRINVEALKEAIQALERHIPEGHGTHPNPEYEIIQKLRAALAALL